MDQPAQVPGKTQGQIIKLSASTLKITNEMNNSQQGFVKYKLCQINLIFFYEKGTDFLERRKAEDAIYLDSNVAFDSHAAFSLTS